MVSADFVSALSTVRNFLTLRRNYPVQFEKKRSLERTRCDNLSWIEAAIPRFFVRKRLSLGRFLFLNYFLREAAF